VPTLLVSNDHHYASAASAPSERRLSDDDREHPQRSAARRARNTCGATLGMYSSLTDEYWFIRKNRKQRTSNFKSCLIYGAYVSCTSMHAS